ncbi:MAG: hypothetical protein MZW92_22190 [Comamonadaceae bacterium]|nr:hypothetical protein [Comamonadaceae bacterium]
MDTPSTTALPSQAIPDQDEHARTRLLNAAVRVVRSQGLRRGVGPGDRRDGRRHQAGALLPLRQQGRPAPRHPPAGGTRVQRGDGREPLPGPASARDRVVGALRGRLRPVRAARARCARVAHAGVPRSARTARHRSTSRVFETRFRAGRRADRRRRHGGRRDYAPCRPRTSALAVMGILEGCNERQLHPAFEPVGRDGVRRLIDLLFDGVMRRAARVGRRRP